MLLSARKITNRATSFRQSDVKRKINLRWHGIIIFMPHRALARVSKHVDKEKPRMLMKLHISTQMNYCS